MNKKNKYIFISSANYSGSTLLTMLMNCHPDVFSLGEFYQCYSIKDSSIKDPLNFQCSCYQPLVKCDYWKAIHWKLSPYFERNVDFENLSLTPVFSNNHLINKFYLGFFNNALVSEIALRIGHFLPSKKRKLAGFIKAHNNYFDHVYEIVGKKCFVDESKNSVYGLVLNKYHRNRQLYIVHLYRHPLKVISSFKKYYPSEDFVNKGLTHWFGHEKMFRRIFRKYDNVIDVTYEAICNDPIIQLDLLYEKLGLESGHSTTDLKKTNHHIVGNTMRFLGNYDGVVSDHNWRDRLTNSEVTIASKKIDELRAKHSFVNEMLNKIDRISEI
jgi:Sulfotransferase family